MKVFYIKTVDLVVRDMDIESARAKVTTYLQGHTQTFDIQERKSFEVGRKSISI